MSEKADYDRPIRRALRELLRISEKSRAQIADELSQKLGRHISEPILTNWASDSKRTYRIPGDVIAALADDALLRSLMSPEQLAKFELGEWGMKHLEVKPRVRKRS